MYIVYALPRLRCKEIGAQKRGHPSPVPMPGKRVRDPGLNSKPNIKPLDYSDRVTVKTELFVCKIHLKVRC